VRIALAIAVPLVAALLQASLVPFIAIGPARPNLPLLVAGSWSVAAGAAEAVWWAFVGGLASDLLSGGPLGAFAAASLAPVAAIGLGERSLVRPVPVLAAAGSIGVAALAAGLGYVALLALVGQPLPALPALLFETVIGALYTAALAVVAYPVARGLRALTEQQTPF
jgi:rod shape-determining protein MreD